jgi:two-component system, OmpR family, alkaline phosphatase synthesis response regulator PhoP
MKKFSLLIVEDEENLGATLRDYFSSRGYQTFWAPNAQQAHALFNLQIDLALLDINLPDGNGLKLAQELREKNKELIFIFLSAMNDPTLRVEGLEIGAEDYITKPFELKELTLRLERILQYKRRSSTAPEELVFGSLRFWPRRFEVQDGQGQIISLGQKETAILQQLISRMGEVVSRDELIEDIWGEEAFPTNRTVDNYIVKLRKWCESDPSSPIKISSVRGVGYRLEK